MPVIHLKGISYIHLQAGEKKNLVSTPQSMELPHCRDHIQPHGIR